MTLFCTEPGIDRREITHRLNENAYAERENPESYFRLFGKANIITRILREKRERSMDRCAREIDEIRADLESGNPVILRLGKRYYGFTLTQEGVFVESGFGVLGERRYLGKTFEEVKSSLGRMIQEGIFPHTNHNSSFDIY